MEVPQEILVSLASNYTLKVVSRPGRLCGRLFTSPIFSVFLVL